MQGTAAGPDKFSFPPAVDLHIHLSNWIPVHVKRNLPACGEINQFGDREGAIHARFYTLSANTFA
jgi:hypothetical protein